MAKKILFLIVFLLSSGMFVLASSSDSLIKFYSNLKSCTRDSFSYSAMGMFTAKNEILGRNGNACILKEQTGPNDFMKCNLPIDVATKYAEENIRLLRGCASGETCYSSYVNQINNDEKYCSFK